jgi:two-component system NtrC family response regulator
VNAKAKVLIVDDDASQRRLLEFWLQEEGYATVTANDGAAGLLAFEQDAPSLVISDLRMPGMNGIELLGRIKALNADIPVILITAFGTVTDAVEAMKLGATDYLLKPVNAEELKVDVRRALDQRQLLEENRYLRDLAGNTFRFENMVAQSRRMRDAIEIAAQVARRESTVLLTGESGTGKEVLAKAIHQNSLRAGKPFITVNCGALPEELAESELFGHRKGSFTGALSDRIGKFEAANEGTIFLDEIGELPLNLQVKLLRVIQEREIDKIGNPRPVPVNVRIIAATNRDLKNLVEDGEFREDLFYRLSVVAIEIAPLRERRDDIPLLIQHFLTKVCTRYNVPQVSLAEAAMERMRQYDWPGNVRELENAVERLIVLAKSNVLHEQDLPPEIRRSESRIAAIDLKLPDDGISLEEVERELILRALEKHAWNQTRTARYLNLTRKTLIYRMEKFNLMAPASSTK